MALKVLMVEDNDWDASRIRHCLEAGCSGCDVRRVRRASEIWAFTSSPYDVILLDLSLPDAHGLETLTGVRKTLAAVPIVMLCYATDEEVAESCLGNGAQDYVFKESISEELLRRAIRHSIEKQRLELALERSRSEYRKLIENAPYGICRSDREGNLLDVNQVMVSMLGCDSREQALELNLASDVYSEAEVHSRLVEERFSRGGMSSTEAVWKRRDGQLVNVGVTGHLACHGDAGVEYLEMFAEDVTSRIALEEQLRQTQKMEAVGQLAGGVAHEINNMLSIILADTELIRRALPAECTDLTNDVEEVRQVAIRGGKLVKRLLGFSRRQRLSVEVIDLTEVVVETVGMLRRLVPEFVKIECEAAEPLTRIRIDPATVEQILLNLTTNARDAMPDGGTLSISTGSTELDRRYCLGHPGARPGPVAYLRVSDTGIGMDDETREQVFEPFFSTKPRGKGTGLGLSTVYGLVKQQAGYIAVESEANAGTTIDIFFPLVEADSTPKRRESGPARHLEGVETVLVVEDEAELRRAAQRALERFGYTVLLASDGTEGLDRYRRYPGKVDLILTDVVMPNMSGPALAETVLAECGGNAPEIVFTSGYSSGDLRSGDLLDGKYSLLEKPWELATLLDTVRKVLDARESSSRAKMKGAA